MRISPGALLVIIAVMIPFVVEFRTVAAYFGVGLSLTQTALIGVVLVGGLVAWALLPESNGQGGAVQ